MTSDSGADETRLPKRIPASDEVIIRPAAQGARPLTREQATAIAQLLANVRQPGSPAREEEP